MRSRPLIFPVVLFLLSVFSAAGQAAETEAESILELNLGKEIVGINSGFNGETIEAFGLKRPDDDLVLIVKGPPRDIMVRRKDHVFGGWVNAKHVVFEHVPSFYRVAASRDVEEMSNFDFLEKHEIGTDHLHFMYKETKVRKENIVHFRDALIREKSRHDLYSADWQEIGVLEDRFYRASFYLPHNVPVGDYELHAYAFREGEMVAHRQAGLSIEKIGLNDRVSEYSRRRPFLYGLLCVFLALYMGWLSYKLKPRLKT
jgi:uncharacterized protein (TIGR02186 family)